MRSTTNPILSALVAFGLLASACGGADADSATTAETTTTVAEVEAAPETTTPVAEVVEEPKVKEPTATEESEPESEPEPEPEAEPETEEEPEAEEEPDAEEAPADAANADLVRVSGMSLAELDAVVQSVHGPTDNFPAEVNRVGYFPSDVPTPPDAEVLDVVVETNHYEFNETHYRSNQFRVSSSLDADAALDFYETTLGDLGYSIEGTGSQTDSEGFKATFMDTMLPESTNSDRHSLNIQIREGDYDGVRIHFWYRGSEAYAGQVEGLNTWDDRNPLPINGVAEQSRISTAYREGLDISEYGFGLTMIMNYEADEEEIRELFRSSIAENGFTLDDSSNLSQNTVWLEGDDRYNKRQISFYSDSDESSITMNTRVR